MASKPDEDDEQRRREELNTRIERLFEGPAARKPPKMERPPRRTLLTNR